MAHQTMVNVHIYPGSIMTSPRPQSRYFLLAGCLVMLLHWMDPKMRGRPTWQLFRARRYNDGPGLFCPPRRCQKYCQSHSTWHPASVVQPLSEYWLPPICACLSLHLLSATALDSLNTLLSCDSASTCRQFWHQLMHAHPFPVDHFISGPS